MLHQFIHQHLTTLVMHIVVTRTMNKQQVTFQPLYVCNRRTLTITFRICLRCIHVTFLINRVIQPLVGYEGNGNTRTEYIRIAEHTIQCLAASSAPACNTDTGSINE